MTQHEDPDMATTDLDRRVAGWLRDEPGRVPERPVEAALAHARAHPRRRDVLVGLRPDPMDGYGFARLGQAGRGGSRLVLVGSLALLLVASIAAASIGGVFDGQDAVLPPDRSPTPSVVPSPSPVLPSASPVPSVLPGEISVDLEEVNGADASIDIVDASGTLVRAVSGQPRDGGSVDGQTVDVAQGDVPNSLVLTWTGGPCDTTHDLDIAADGRTITLRRPTCVGDSIARDLVLVLTFASPVAPADVAITLETVGE